MTKQKIQLSSHCDIPQNITELTEHGDVEPEVILRNYEKRFFPGVPTITAIRVQKMQNAGCYFPLDNCLCISESIAQSWKLVRIIILHELIHHKLRCENGDDDPKEGIRFQAELDRLWAEGIYRKLL